MQPRVILNMPEPDYHAHPALSSTSAKKILSSPAKFNYERSNPPKPKAEFDVGSAAHGKVLGVGDPIEIIPDDLLSDDGGIRTKAAKEFVQKARDENKIPIKSGVARQVDAMAEAVLAHPTARAFLEQPGDPEVSLFATDPDTGVDVRCRFDYLPHDVPGRRLVTVDLKTIGTDATPHGFATNAARFGYDLSRAHYLHTLNLATGIDDAEMVFIVVEAYAPYLTAAHVLSREFKEMGAEKAKRARELFAECTALGQWPGYTTEVQVVAPPVWSIYDFQDAFGEGAAA